MSHTVRARFPLGWARDFEGAFAVGHILRLGVAGCLTFVAAVSGYLTVTAAPASAYDVRQPQIVTDNPADWTPNVQDGEIRYLAQAGNTMIAGGLFTQVANAGSSTVLPRTDVFAFDATTGAVASNFHPTLDGEVYAVVPSPDGNSVFLAGAFAHVNGVAKKYLAEVSLADGSIVPTFKPAALDGRLYTMRLAGNQLYVGGAFKHVGTNATVHHLAAFDPVSGALNTAFHLDFAGLANPQPDKTGWVTMVTKIDISPDGSRLAAIGNFATVNGLDRAQVVLADMTTATPSVLGWQTDFYKKFCNATFESYVHDVAFSPDGSYFVIGTTGSYNKVVTTGCDSTARWESGATGSALMPTWVDFTGKDTIWSIAITDTAIYTGGHNRWQNNPYGADSAGAGAAPRPGLSALDPVTGVPFDWNPTRTTGVGVFDLLATDQGLWIGDDTDWVGHEYHYKLAFFPLTGGKTVPHPTTGGLPTTLYQLGKAGTPTQTVGSCGSVLLPGLNDLVTNRSFDGSTAGLTLPTLNANTAWGQTRGTFMLSGTVYSAWADGTICRSAFNGTTFGASTPIDLAPAGVANKIVADIPTMTGMFFANNRIYYTKSGSSALYYHYFTPQNDMVGAYVFTASGNVSGIDFSKVGGMFLVGNKLYFVTRADGVLHRINWNGSGPVAGTAVNVSGPGIDGATSWASQALFGYVPAGAVAANQPPYANIASNCDGRACVFTSSGSGDADGTLTSYSWDFGDGGTSSARVPSNTYGADGSYTVTLTVVDDDGATATTSRVVKVGTVPVPPVPAFTVACTHLSCSVDGSSSTAPGSTITSYDWTFGDGATASGVTAANSYASDGTYQIALTVTNAQDLSASTAQSVSVSSVAPPISFVGESDVNGNAKSWSVHVPAAVAPGDGLVMMTSGNASATYSAPSGPGWSLVGTKTAASIVTSVWQKAADAADAGSLVTVTGSTTVKANVVLLAYHGTAMTNPVGSFAVAGATSTTATHVTPTTTAASDGSWVVSIWSDKSSATTAISGPAGQNQRYLGCSTSGGHVCSLVDDSGPVNGGTPVGGLTATMNSASSADTMWTLVLAAQT